MNGATDRPQTTPSQPLVGYREDTSAETTLLQQDWPGRYEGALVDARQSLLTERGLGLAAAAMVVFAIIIAAIAYLVEVPHGDTQNGRSPAPLPKVASEEQARSPPETASVADVAFFRDHGRPPIEAIWQGRMRLASPSEWAGGTSPPAAGSKLAYAPEPAARGRDDTPFALIDEADRARRASLSRAAIAPSDQRTAASGDDDDDDDDEEDDEPPAPASIPRPLPRPKIASEPQPPAQPQRSPEQTAVTDARAPGAATVPPGAPQLQQPATPAPAAPASAASQRRQRDAPQHETQNYSLLEGEDEPEVKLASLPPPAATAYAPPAVTPSNPPAATTPQSTQPLITLRTPFGIPYLLQQDSVQASCFPPPLVDLIRRVEARYGQKPIVTSGLRDRGRRGSLHRRCQAADIMIPGVSSGELARVARQIPGMGGVGQYCHPNLVHIDIGTPRDWKQGCGGFFALRDGGASRKP